ncbi:DUF305 domain-containing protein [Nodosilinea sp. E11]|uniref:DUF305 domain-containing protein n=1 Tax=Nodosilinea sp. E11 TaxID=3037479 RepID=UPI002934FEDC|nr:DUF305 domain-containing protein [Nodosilinea sp. E11]WOD37135.1 DUF305 domain-containing protein [Nodosilinea sp. E11]
MELSTKSIAAISGLGALAVGAIAIPLIFSSPIANPLQQPGRPGWQMPMNQGAGRGHHQHMMQMMQANNEFEFLSLMIPHHEEAIATAQRVLEYSDRPEMRAFAQDIIEVQTAEIEQMEAWLDAWYPGQETSQTYSPMMRDLSQLEGNDLDQAFLEDMIMHHMGAVMMSQRLVNHGLVEHSEVQPFAQNIANTQRQEIWQMQAWLQDWYGISGMPGPMHQGRR